MVRRPSWGAGSVRETLPEGQEALPVDWEWSGGPTGGPGVVEMAWNGKEALPKG